MKVFFSSLGCDKNLVDFERMLGMFSRKGYEITDDETAADVIVVNTCCFINDAKEESINTILEMARLRTEGSCRALIVTGCLAQRYRQEIIDEIPEVDAIVGTSSYDHVIEAAEKALGGSRYSKFEDINRRMENAGKRLLSTGGHYAYLKIAEGCNKCCSYCIIPYVRGGYRSYPMEELVNEAAQLAQEGVKELILVAQETTLYGIDLYKKKSLHVLIKELAKISGIRWIRLLYCYPEEIYPELTEVIKQEPKVCHYLDMPIQHVNNDILKRMGRKTTKEELTALIRSLREEIPDIILRTTLITGFPGETQEAHEELLAFVDEMEFNRLGVFTYSPEEGTRAASMPDQISEETKLDRRDELMELQQEVAFDLASQMTGKEIEVMVEGKIADENTYVCRTRGDAPGVDGYLFLNTDENLMSGDFAMVKVTASYEYDLIGELI